MFQTILGQPYAVTVLQGALANGRLAGSYLFTGPDGVGKATTARLFAAALCGAQSDDDPLAKAIQAGTFPDVRETTPGGKSQTYRIGQLWPRPGDASAKEFPPENALLRDLHFEPINGPKRVFIIGGAEAFNEASGNSILKTLEEPPAYAHFVLTATSPSSVLPTIASRCQIVPFGLLPAGDIENALVQRFGVAPGEARFLSTYCEGRLGRAVALARSPSLLAARQDLLDWARDLVAAPGIKSFKLGEELRKIALKLKAEGDDADTGSEKEASTREPLLRALDLLATYYRDVLAARLLGEGTERLVNSDRRAEIAGAASRYTPEQLQRAVALTSDIRAAIERNAHAQLATEVLLTQLTGLRG